MEKRVLDFVSNAIGVIHDYQLLKEGQNAYIYKVSATDATYIVRVGYEKKDPGASLVTAAAVLDILNKSDYQHCAKKIAYSAEEDVLIETCIPGEIKPLNEYSLVELKQFVVALTDLYQLDIPNGSKVPHASPIDDIAVYGVERLNIVADLLPEETELVEWLQKELDQNITFIKGKAAATEKPFLIHGDIGGNVMLHEGMVYFIDWEHARLSEQTQLEYIEIHSHPTAEQFVYIVKEFAQQMKMDEEYLWTEIKEGERITRLNDVIWAAMRWGETKNDDKPDGAVSHRGNSFKQLMLDRKKNYLELLK